MDLATKTRLVQPPIQLGQRQECERDRVASVWSRDDGPSRLPVSRGRTVERWVCSGGLFQLERGPCGGWSVFTLTNVLGHMGCGGGVDDPPFDWALDRVCEFFGEADA